MRPLRRTVFSGRLQSNALFEQRLSKDLPISPRKRRSVQVSCAGLLKRFQYTGGLRVTGLSFLIDLRDKVVQSMCTGIRAFYSAMMLLFDGKALLALQTSTSVYERSRRTGHVEEPDTRHPQSFAKERRGAGSSSVSASSNRMGPAACRHASRFCASRPPSSGPLAA